MTLFVPYLQLHLFKSPPKKMEMIDTSVRARELASRASAILQTNLQTIFLSISYYFFGITKAPVRQVLKKCVES
jgi:hypothetical protein